MPTYPVLGEGVPQPAVAVLVALGALLAGGALWLAQAEGLTPGPATEPSSAMAAPAEAVAAAVASAASSRQATVAGAAAVDLQGESAVVSKVPLPCPGAVAIYFATGKSTTDADAVSVALGDLTAWVRDHAGSRLAIEGHADALGVDETNVLLSFTRAKAVAAVLIAKGLAPSQLQVTAAGSQSLLADKPPDAPENRRVTVQVQDPDGCRTMTR